MSMGEFTINLISNACTTTFPENTLSQFTTLLPQQLTLKGSWEVALSEIAWPASTKNITSDQFKYRLAMVMALKDNESGSSHEVRKNKRRESPMECLQCTSLQHNLLKKLILKKIPTSCQVSM